MVTRAGFCKILVRIANREDPDHASSEALRCLSLFGRQLVFKILDHPPGSKVCSSLNQMIQKCKKVLLDHMD